MGKLEKDLRAMSKSAGVNTCVDETVRLMRCTGGSSRSAGCSNEFILMRECNRADGKQFVSEHGAYEVAPGKSGLFQPAAASLMSTPAPPVRTLQGMPDFGADYAASLWISRDQV